VTKTEPLLKDAIISLLRKSNDWTIIKEIIVELKLDVDRMHPSGYLDAFVDTEILQFKQVSCAKQYRLRSS
jgi:RAB protein geranylgeranyltransferase component A